jgi:imidazolonepropionase-like amidohydrolase
MAEIEAGMWAIKAERCFDGERLRGDGVTVLVEGERIVGVEPLAYDVPDGCDVTAYDGTLLPGLIDAHVHLVAEGTRPGTPGSLELAGTLEDDALDAAIARSLDAQAVAGVTTVRDLGDARYRTLVARDRRSPGEPRIVAAGPPLTTPGGHCHFLGGAVDGVEAARAAVREHVERGVDVVKVMATGGMMTPGTDILGVQFAPAELRAAVDEVHAAGLRIVAHCHSLAGAQHALAAGVDGLEHVTLLTDEGIATPEDLVAAIAEAGVTIDPTVGWDRDRLAPVEQAPPHVRELIDRYGLTPDEVVRRRAAQLARVRELGIRVVSGLDAGVSPPKSHGGVWRSVVELEGAGYSPAEALCTATSVAADDCGLGDTTGRVAAGLAADLLVVDGDLATDLEALSRPVDVRIRGTRIRLG